MTEQEANENLEAIKAGIPDWWKDLIKTFKEETSKNIAKSRCAIGTGWTTEISGTPEKPYVRYYNTNDGPQIALGTKGGKFIYNIIPTNIGRVFTVIDTETNQEEDFSDF